MELESIPLIVRNESIAYNNLSYKIKVIFESDKQSALYNDICF